MAVNTQELIQFFWDSLTDSGTLISNVSNKSNYVAMQIGITFLDRKIDNGWKYVAPEGEFITPQMVQDVVNGIVANINAVATNSSNSLIMKVHDHNNTGPRDMVNSFEFFNVNSLVPYMSIVVTLNTRRPRGRYTNGPVGAYDTTTGASAASGMQGTSITDVASVTGDSIETATYPT